MIIRLVLCGVLMLFASVSYAAPQRIALVIGNGAYQEAPLDNPVQDATDVGIRLRDLGFEVVLATDAGLSTMQSKFLEFASRIEQGATAMIYYAGHGIQANGRNYLLPVDASFQSEQMLRFEALEMADMLEELAQSSASINLIVLDACRNNPFERKFRGGARGLAAVDAATGTLIAYATAPGSVASDGSGKNGLYTQEFLNALSSPGLKVEEVFKQVRINVSGISKGQQVPWESSSLTGDFIFNPSITTEPNRTGVEAVAAVDTETLFWASIKDSDDATVFEEYLERFPSGTFESIATRRIQALTDSDGSLCDDLSGRWVSRSAATNCGSEFWLTQTEPGIYDMSMTMCNVPVFGKVTGKTTVDGNSMTTQWKAVSCSGTTTVRLASDCRSGRGEARATGGLVITCGRAPVKEEIQFIGVELDRGN